MRTRYEKIITRHSSCCHQLKEGASIPKLCNETELANMIAPSRKIFNLVLLGRVTFSNKYISVARPSPQVKRSVVEARSGDELRLSCLLDDDGATPLNVEWSLEV